MKTRVLFAFTLTIACFIPETPARATDNTATEGLLQKRIVDFFGQTKLLTGETEPVHCPPFVVPSCTLPVGTSKEINAPLTWSHYLLKRDEDSSNGHPAFEAVVNIRFVSPDAKLPNGQPADSPFSDEISAKADRCYESLGEVKGPTGETLRIRRASASEAKQVREKNITVLPTMRQDMEDWYRGADCETIIHETFHLLGLVDVYSEAKQAKPITKTAADGSRVVAYDCRASGPDDSIMGQDASKAFGRALGYYRRLECVCSQENFRTCSPALNTIRGVPDSCPMGTTEPREYNGTDYINPVNLSEPGGLAETYLNDGKRDGIIGGKRTKNWKYEGMEWKEPSGGSVLYPAEFRLIAYPGCVQENANYNVCGANAYITSIDKGGCKPAPAACSDPGTWLK